MTKKEEKMTILNFFYSRMFCIPGSGSPESIESGSGSG
jgi:hypothetical protein